MTHPRSGRSSRRRFVASSALGSAAAMTMGQSLRAVQSADRSTLRKAQDESVDVPMFRGNAARTGEMPGPGPDYSNGIEAIWRFPTGGEFMSTPATEDGVLFAGGSILSGVHPANGYLYAVDASNGRERWRFDSGQGALYSSPAVADGVVYVGSRDGNLYAMSAEDGSPHWQFAADRDIDSSPAVVDGMVYFGSNDRNLYAVNARDGTELWRFTGDGPIGTTPAVVDGTVYVYGVRTIDLRDPGNDLYAVDAESGLERWRFETDTIPLDNGGHLISPAVVDDIVYLVTGYGELVLAVNAVDGTERWRFATDGRNFSSPAVADGVVYVASEGNYLYALNAEDGTERWRFETGGRALSSPAVTDGVVHISFITGNIRDAEPFAVHTCGVDAQDGTERWRFTELSNLGAYTSSPVVVGGVVYIGIHDTPSSALYAVSTPVPKLSVGGTARVTKASLLRGGPGPTAVERAEPDTGTVVTITGDAVTTGDAAWWPVMVNVTGEQGWLEASALEP